MLPGRKIATALELEAIFQDALAKGFLDFGSTLDPGFGVHVLDPVFALRQRIRNWQEEEIDQTDLQGCLVYTSDC